MSNFKKILLGVSAFMAVFYASGKAVENTAVICTKNGETATVILRSKNPDFFVQKLNLMERSLLLQVKMALFPVFC